MRVSHKINLHDFLLAWVVSTHVMSLYRLQQSRRNHGRHQAPCAWNCRNFNSNVFYQHLDNVGQFLHKILLNTTGTNEIMNENFIRLFLCFFLFFQKDYAIPQILICTLGFFPAESEKTRYWFCEDVWVDCSVLQQVFSQELRTLILSEKHKKEFWCRVLFTSI